MSKKSLLFTILLLIHGAVTCRALLDLGYVDLFRFAFSSWPAAQIFSDLSVGMVLVTSWMIGDAPRTGRKVWPYVVATLPVGSFAPLTYLLVGSLRSAPPERVGPAPPSP